MEPKLIKKITPSKKEKDRIKEIVRYISNKINQSLKKQKINAEITLGGSVAKGTWLPGLSDIDFFLKFCRKYNNLSDLTEKILSNFKAERIKGSRDYFLINYEGFEIEVVPVLETKEPKKAENITDISPLHVDWIKSKIKNNTLQNEIKKAKLFLKAQKCYGAESYIKGFSGHVTDILIYYYKSFDNFIKEASKWKDKIFIDAEKHYKNKKEAISKMNESKLYGPMIVVDPIQPERNAAAALSKEKFDLLIKASKEYLKKPDISFFEDKRITLTELKKRKGNLIVLKAIPLKKRKDAAGAELLKRFQKIKRKLKEADFKILDSGWQWYPKEKAMYWFYFKEKELSRTKRHNGPLLDSNKEDIKKFKGKWKNFKKNKRYYVIINRKYTHPKELLKKVKGVKIIYSY